MIEKIESKDSGKRLDLFIKSIVPDWISRTHIQKFIKDKKILINNKKSKPSYKLKENDIIYIDIPDKPEPVEVLAENIPLDIIYEDSDIIVVNKQPNLIVHPAYSIVSGTLVNALLYHCKDLKGIGGELRPGIVHRLDKNTSGTIVIAKNDIAMNSLAKQFKDRVTKKTYLALVKGHPQKEGKINAPIARHPTIRIKMSVVEDGKNSLTLYKNIKSFKDGSLMWITLKTGRTHQIRVHFKHIGHPLFGDEVYGKHDNELGIYRQMLHAFTLGFYHPRSEKWMRFVAKLPNDFKKAIITLNSR
ncbi:pseudouridine synthase [Tepiditoga spiralis]|uniref:Pseudouridine synthase n=1 Tax=Tepiditoga spiralis TaxID=2108365 RepID=A0A7G1G3D3_9BACT|nr:RluA family pseudouridine synthase [Tepiditoga spiralis]BBE30871.1 pseudouridine synthase [Tepiditoga spiralis]